MGSLEGFRKAKAYFLMLFLQAGFAGMYVISVASLKQGMNHYVLVVYRNGVAAIVMAPLAFWFERSSLSLPFSLFLSRPLLICRCSKQEDAAQDDNLQLLEDYADGFTGVSESMIAPSSSCYKAVIL